MHLTQSGSLAHMKRNVVMSACKLVTEDYLIRKKKNASVHYLINVNYLPHLRIFLFSPSYPVHFQTKDNSFPCLP